MNTSMSYAVFLEPRGILKVLQFIFVICAFACTCDFRGRVVLPVACRLSTEATTTPEMTTMTNSTETTTQVGASPQSEVEFFDAENIENVEFVADFQYPFNLGDSYDEERDCRNDTQTMRLEGNYTSTASFYVFVGVMGMLFSIFAIVVYVFFQPTYEFMEWIPITDTVIHGVFTLMWFGSAIAWATALTQIKKHTKTDGVHSNNPDICGVDYQDCNSVPKIEYQLLDFSVIFGFLNVILYGGNVWFVFKETKYFKKPVTS